MKFKRFMYSIIAMVMCVVSLSTTALAAPISENSFVEESAIPDTSELKFIPLEVTAISPEPDSPNAGYQALVADAKDGFYYSESVTVTIPSAITYTANRVGIIITDQTDGTKGAVFNVKCTNKPISNTNTYTVGAQSSWKYYRLVGLSPSGGDSVTIEVSLKSGNATHKYSVAVGLFYYG